MKLQTNDSRIDTLRNFYRGKGATSIHLVLASNLYWLLGGRVQVGVGGVNGVCEVVVNNDGIYVITNTIEERRLREEEIGDNAEFLTSSWKGPLESTKFKALLGVAPLEDKDYEADMCSLRSVLLEGQIEELRLISLAAGAAMEKTCFSLQRGMSEHEIASLIAQQCYAQGLEPIVLFAACDERISRYRHALSTDNRLDRIAMISLGARKHGLNTSITRFVSFGEVDEQTKRAQEAVNKLAALLYAKSRPAASYLELFSELERGYQEVGYPDEILLHHQGGLAGFQVREVKINGRVEGIVQANQVFAWNPSITGFKSEDLLLIGTQENQILTQTPNLPSETVSYEGKTFSLSTFLVR